MGQRHSRLLSDKDKFEINQKLFELLSLALPLEYPQATTILDIPSDLILEIAEKLDNFKDIVALIGVCRQWREACRLLAFASAPPFLMNMYRSTARRDVLTIHHEYEMIFEIDLPELSSYRCFGSPYGWVFAIHDAKLEAKMVNPISQKSVELPTFTDPGILNQVEKAMMFNIGVIPNKLLVVVILKSSTQMAFCLITEGAWNWVKNPSGHKFSDVAMVGDKLYALCNDGEVVQLLFHNYGEPELKLRELASTPTLVSAVATTFCVEAPSNQFVGRSPDQEDFYCLGRGYLVQAGCWLYAIFRYSTDDDIYKDSIFRVFRLESCLLDIETDGWSWPWDSVEDSLGEQAVIVGNGTSWSVQQPENAGLQANTIYFGSHDECPNCGMLELQIAARAHHFTRRNLTCVTPGLRGVQF